MPSLSHLNEGQFKAALTLKAVIIGVHPTCLFKVNIYLENHSFINIEKSSEAFFLSLFSLELPLLSQIWIRALAYVINKTLGHFYR